MPGPTAQLRKAIRGELKEPQLAEISAHFFQMAGGPRKVALMLFTEYLAAKRGSMIRQRILDMILRTTKYANDKGGGSDLSLLSDDDLEKELILALDSVQTAEKPPDAEAQASA